MKNISNKFQSVLEVAFSSPAVIEDSDSFDVVVNKDAHYINPGEGQHNNIKEFFYSIEVGKMRIFNIETACFLRFEALM